jgi:hypothetical protein
VFPSIAFYTRNFYHQEPLLLWRTFAEARVSLSEGGAVAMQTLNDKWSLTTTGTELMEGKHYWEAELLQEEMFGILIGISRPNLDPAGEYYKRGCTDGWFIGASNGGLYGNGKQGAGKAGSYKQGDRVGVMLDLDNGSLRFFKNGVEHGPGYPAGSVAGPVVHAAQLYFKDSVLRLLPNVVAPTGV